MDLEIIPTPVNGIDPPFGLKKEKKNRRIFTFDLSILKREVKIEDYVHGIGPLVVLPQNSVQCGSSGYRLHTLKLWY